MLSSFPDASPDFYLLFRINGLRWRVKTGGGEVNFAGISHARLGPTGRQNLAQGLLHGHLVKRRWSGALSSRRDG